MLKYTKSLIFKNNECPIYLTYFVTSKCNLKCQHCFYWDSLNKINNELSLEEIERFSKSIKNLLVLSLTGGEPFLRSDLDRIVKILYNNSKPKIISIVSNGYFTERCLEITKSILDNCRNISLIIELSIDGLEENHNLIRMNNDSFKNVLQTFYKLKKLKRKHPNLNIGIITTFNSFNQYRMLEIMGFVKKELNPDSFTLSLTRGNPKNIESKRIDIEQYKKVTRIKNKIFKNGYNNFYLSSLRNANEKVIEDVVYNTIKYNKFQTECYASSLNAVMSPEGDILGCETLNNKIGNIRDFDYDFKKLWAIEKRINMSKSIINNKCFCTHECNISVNTLFNIKHYPKLTLKLVDGIIK
ncbi:radical SAM protein [Candidatus Woesearchaeota archaeon]|nr:radical SAM protein [Candidatus Woesearchaeota archaeon]